MKRFDHFYARHSSPYMANPWKGITPAGGYATSVSALGAVPLGAARAGDALECSKWRSTSVSRKKHSNTCRDSTFVKGIKSG